MEYKLQLAETNGDIVPLDIVAMTMARRDAMAGGEYHDPMFKGRLPRYRLALLEAVRDGRLKVCDTVGELITVDRRIEATAHFGYATRFVNEPDWETLHKENPDGVLSHIDFGPREIDKNSPNIAWFAKLDMLNEWAKTRGDSFVISHEGAGWIDERGYVEPPNQDRERSGVNPKAKPKLTATESTSNSWTGKQKDGSPSADVSEIHPLKWYTISQTAKLLSRSKKHVREVLIAEGKLKAEKQPNHWKVQGQTIIDYIKKK